MFMMALIGLNIITLLLLVGVQGSLQQQSKQLQRLEKALAPPPQAEPLPPQSAQP